MPRRRWPIVIPLWLVLSLPSRPCPGESFHIISQAISMNVQMVTIVYHCPRKKNISSQLPNKKGVQYPAMSYIFLYTILDTRLYLTPTIGYPTISWSYPPILSVGFMPHEQRQQRPIRCQTVGRNWWRKHHLYTYSIIYHHISSYIYTNYTVLERLFVPRPSKYLESGLRYSLWLGTFNLGPFHIFMGTWRVLAPWLFSLPTKFDHYHPHYTPIRCRIYDHQII